MKTTPGQRGTQSETRGSEKQHSCLPVTTELGAGLGLNSHLLIPHAAVFQ